MRLFLFFIACCCVINLSAQEKRVYKKIEKRTIDQNGNETIVVEGDDEMPAMDKDGEYLTVDKNIDNGIETTIYTLTKKKNGEVNVIKWDGKGEMPAEIKKKMEGVDMKVTTKDGMSTITIDAKDGMDKDGEYITITNTNDGKKESSEYTLTKKENGEVEVIKWDGTGEMPSEIKEKTKGTKTIIRDKHGKTIHIDTNTSSDKSNKPRLGILINDNGRGVIVDEVFKDGVADKAGIKKGDLILKINNEYIFSQDQLIDQLNALGKGLVKISYVRDKQEKQVEAKFD